MREIKFTTNYEPVLSFSDQDFKTKYEERVGNNPGYVQKVRGETKHLALCPRCNNPVAILGIYKKINVAPHARHAKEVNIPNVAQYDEYKFQNCPYHNKRADYIKEYVDETEELQRQDLYKIAKEHYDKAIYLLQKETGIYITLAMAETLAENYVIMRAYNYIDATVYNIPWYLIYSFHGFPLYHMIIRKNSTLYKHLLQQGFVLKNSKIKEHIYVADNKGCLLTATNYRYVVDKNDNLNEWLDFSILRPDDKVTDTLLYVAMDRFSIKVDSYYFGNLINYSDWNPRQKVLHIAERYMNP
ncbi:MAG: hypothetical protein ACLS67_10240 [Anaerobutyricum soehngenii]